MVWLCPSLIHDSRCTGLLSPFCCKPQGQVTTWPGCQRPQQLPESGRRPSVPSHCRAGLRSRCPQHPPWQAWAAEDDSRRHVGAVGTPPGAGSSALAVQLPPQAGRGPLHGQDVLLVPQQQRPVAVHGQMDVSQLTDLLLHREPDPSGVRGLCPRPDSASPGPCDAQGTPSTHIPGEPCGVRATVGTHGAASLGPLEPHVCTYVSSLRTGPTHPHPADHPPRAVSCLANGGTEPGLELGVSTVALGLGRRGTRAVGPGPVPMPGAASGAPFLLAYTFPFSRLLRACCCLSARAAHAALSPSHPKYLAGAREEGEEEAGSGPPATPSLRAAPGRRKQPVQGARRGLHCPADPSN